MAPTSQTAKRITRSAVAALGAFLTTFALVAAPSAPPAGAADRDSLTIIVVGHGAAFTAQLEISCESPTRPPTADGTELGSALTTARTDVAVPADGFSVRTIADLTSDTACSVTAHGTSRTQLGAVDGGTPLVDGDGQLSGVAVTVDRGTTATASLTFTIPVDVASRAPRTESVPTTTTGSGSAVTPAALPGGTDAASAAAPVALAAARSTTMASSAALPDTSGSGTTLVLASIGVLLCGAIAYVLVLKDRHHRHPGPTD
jgi:hypothetical protein